MLKVALFDFDNTLYNGISYFDILRYQVEKDLIDPLIEDKNRKLLKNYKAGIIPYEEAAIGLLEKYATALTDLSYDRIFQSTIDFFNQYSSKIYSFARPVIDLLQSTHELYIVTGAPQFVAQNAADTLGVRGYISSNFEVTDNRFTGKVLNHLAYDYEKTLAINSLLPNIDFRGSFAFGDSEGDIDMLKTVENAICINPTPALQQEATAHGWPIATPDTIEQLVAQRLH